MIYTKLTKKAMNFLYKKQKDQFDKSGTPYVFHPWHVAENVSDEKTATVALLHDIMEKTDTTEEDLRKQNFPEDVIEAIKILTHNQNVSYREYIENIGKNLIATEVKIAALSHNMNLSRLNNVTDEDLIKVKEYRDSYNYLREIYTKQVNESKKIIVGTKHLDKLTPDIRMKSGILGLAVGDALGVPVEYTSREVLEDNPISEMKGFGAYQVPEGTWSDDTSMTIAAMDSIKECGAIDYYDIMKKFSEWKNQAKYTATDIFFNIGMITSKAIHNFESGIEPTECGCRQVFENGNGSLMRILPFVYYLTTKKHTEEEKVYLINEASSLTHAHEISRLGCKIYCDYVLLLLEGMDKQVALEKVRRIKYSDFYSKDSIQKYNRIFSPNFKELEKSEISSTGYVVDTLESSIWCTLNSENFEEAVEKAINLGKDTDTIGAVTGSINGIIYGENNIPKKWLDKLKKKDMLETLSDEFINKLKEIENTSDNLHI